MWFIRNNETEHGPRYEIGFFNPKGIWECIGHTTHISGAIQVCSALNGGNCPDAVLKSIGVILDL